jgi:hypothetical protein
MRYLSMSVLLTAFLASAGPGAAQTVTGRLLDTSTGRPIESGTLALVSEGATVASAATDTSGNFVLTAPRAGSYSLRAERIGYRTAETAPLDLGARDTLQVEFRLSVDAVAMNPITVIGYSQRPSGQLGGFYDRQRSAIGGQFITREDIDRRSPTYVTDLLRTVPGVLVRPGPGGNIVVVRGGCVPRVFLDGVPITLAGTSIDELVHPADLEGIEVYRGPSELPALFSQGACGAIALWTRRGS